MTDQSYTAAEIAQIMSVHKTTIIRRGKKESWPAVAGNGKGGAHAKYPLATLPQDVQLAIYNKEGAPAEMIPALSPAVALAAMERPVEAPTSASSLKPRSQRGRRVNTSRDGSLLPEVTPASPAHNNKDAAAAFPMTAPGLEPARRYAYEQMPAWSPERAISESSLYDPRIARILAVIRDVEAMPANWGGGRDAWVKSVAIKHDVARQSVYRWLAKYDKRGIAGLEHRKSSSGKPKAWTPEAVDFWVGLCLKPTQRKMTLKAIYEDCLILEAQRRNWDVGCLESAIWWYNKKATPDLRAIRDGGMRALDNLLPPVLRDYSDMAPFEMLVGDQHRFDFWVVDDDTGAVFRPECYLWQDLRTRVIYGMAFDRRYDAHLCGEALRIGMRIWGCFNAIYTDNGSSELSKYIMGILSGIRSMGMEWEQTLDAPMDLLDIDGEEVQPVVKAIAPGTHKKAIVKNAKAKLIEKTFDIFEEILRSKFRLPGSVKRLTDDIHTQDVDHQEAMKLAADGRLLLASEFYMTAYLAADYYNRQKAHRGVRREWMWRPKPAEVTPYDCLMACYRDGWRPRMITDEAADMLFLQRIRRTVQLGRITIDGEIYEHDALLGLPKSQPVECRFRPLERDIALVYLDGKFLCPAHPVEYSSMKDADLAERKIIEKRAKRKAIAERFRAYIKSIPDLRNYSEVPEAERVAALVGQERKRIEAARSNEAKCLTPEQLAVEVEKLEAIAERIPDERMAAMAMSAARKPLPPRPDYWTSNVDRYLWCIQCQSAGGDLNDADLAFVAEQEAQMTPDERARWQFEREYANG